MAAKITDRSIALLVVLFVAGMFVMGIFTQKAEPAPANVPSYQSVNTGVATITKVPLEAQQQHYISTTGVVDIIIEPASR